jgi:hypothetical protein
MTKLVPAKSTPSEEISAGFDKLAQPGWCLLTGHWIADWAALENMREVEILAGDTVVQPARLNRARSDIDARLKLPEKGYRSGLLDQVDLSVIGDYAECCA